ncbi:MAG: TetR/AcrR family transcriptional regulator [Ancrocorticia sp.]|jgi:AcrR family transcriptional regulator|nr:TetR/AcrR family transcriptional regulator [Ancrocorticia sp.]MCI1895746.1 TetR/AcrR family transcriptional regulator [Ancrocorticia sp.]MCI1932740.1 TetR/AcrR family transcriptional regulator [Ancrocorticia sp.]MCI1964163.1 TetR/AcrR family transcriptional regulator [Ancrocorticia sp.]MCI2002600.1 TetR/AcrR family transcriptional regulator [Ancrocorticia sp.]
MARQARTTENLKERMANALFELLREKPYAEISVSEITDRADVGRATYYRHFGSKDDVLMYRFGTIFSRVPHPAKPFHKHTAQDATAFFEQYFASLYEHRAILEEVYEAGLDYLLFIYMYRLTVAQSRDAAVVDRYRVALHSASTFAIVDQWVTSGFEQSPDELADMIVNQLFSKHTRRAEECG